jgi:5-methylcytosine-specific restriction endonuclease McrA
VIVFPRCCSVCGGRAVPGTNRCVYHPKPVVTEAERLQRQPGRHAYTTAEYRRNRIARYQLADGRCENCGKLLGREEFETHHLLPKDDPRTNELAYLRNACKICHKAATAAARRARRAEPEA